MQKKIVIKCSNSQITQMSGHGKIMPDNFTTVCYKRQLKETEGLYYITEQCLKSPMIKNCASRLPPPPPPKKKEEDK